MLVLDQITHMQYIIPGVDLNKFDGVDPTREVTQIEHYFSLHGIIDDLLKL